MVDLSARFGGACARSLGLLGSMPPGAAALACLEGTTVHRGARDRGLEVHTVARSKWDPRIPARLTGIIRAGGFEVVDTQNAQSKLWATCASMLTRTALVSTLNSWYEAEHRGGLKGRLYQGVERATARWTDMFVAVAPDIRERLLMSGVEDDRIALIRNAIDVRPSTEAADPLWLQRMLGLPPDATVLCAVGRLVPAKGYEHLVTALELLAGRYSNLHCVVVGDGELRSALDNRLARAGLSDRVHLAGFRPPEEALAIVRAADLFVMPSVTEGTPIALLEAGALGKPIVATRAGGIPEIVTDGRDGILVPPAAPGALAIAISRLLDDRALAERLSAAVREKVVRDFTREAQVAATLTAYHKAWARRRRAGRTTTSRSYRGSASTNPPSNRSAASAPSADSPVSR